MNLLLYENQIFKTKLNVAQVRERLAEIVEPRDSFPPYSVFRDDNPVRKPFEGEIDDQGFGIRKVILYRNSFVPDIKGEFGETSDGTTIRVKINLSGFVAVFLTLWISGVLFAFVSILYDSVVKGKFEWVIVLPMLMLWFMYTLVFEGLKRRANEFREIFTKLLDPE